MLSVLNEEHAAGVKFSVERSATMPARVVLRGQATRGSRLILIAGYDGPELPERLTDVVVEPADSGEQAWCLRCAEGEFRFRASAVERLEGRPDLWEPLHRPFALRPGERRMALLLLALLRLPGGAWLLRRWHGSRG